MIRILLVLLLYSLPSVAYASDVVGNTSLPWNSGVHSLYEELTGPIPQILAVIALAVQGAIWCFIEMGPMTPAGTIYTMRMVFGVAIAINAIGLVSVVCGSSLSGCGF